jgi:threonyl-tRNA synthetase
LNIPKAGILSSIYSLCNQRPALGKRVFWHSSAHVLGEAAERHYGCHLCIGPPTEDGFFYEMAIDDRPVTTADYPSLEKVSDIAIKDKQKFERLVVPKETLLEMFSVSISLTLRSSWFSIECGV